MKVKVAPNSKKFEAEEKDGEIVVKLKNPAENNRANLELLKELEKRTGGKARIVSGLKSKRKEVWLEVGDEEAVKKILR